MSSLAKEGFYSEEGVRPSRPILSLEARAEIIADAATSLPFEGRRERVAKIALEQMRAAVAIGSLRHLADDRPEYADD